MLIAWWLFSSLHWLIGSSFQLLCVCLFKDDRGANSGFESLTAKKCNRPLLCRMSGGMFVVCTHTEATYGQVVHNSNLGIARQNAQCVWCSPESCHAQPEQIHVAAGGVSPLELDD